MGKFTHGANCVGKTNYSIRCDDQFQPKATMI